MNQFKTWQPDSVKETPYVIQQHQMSKPQFIDNQMPFSESKGSSNCTSELFHIQRSDYQIQTLPQNLMQMFIQSSPRNRPHPLFKAFFSQENLQYILNQIEKHLFDELGEHVTVAINNTDTIEQFIKVASSNLGLVSFPQSQALQYMNASLIQHEAFIAKESLLWKRLHKKYFIDQDRLRVMPYGALSKETKGTNVLSEKGYMISHPWKRNRNQALLLGNGLIPVPKSSILSNCPPREPCSTATPKGYQVFNDPNVNTNSYTFVDTEQFTSNPMMYNYTNDQNIDYEYANIYGYLQAKNVQPSC